MIEISFYVAFNDVSAGDFDAEQATRWLDNNFVGIFSRMREHNASFEVRLIPLLSALGRRQGDLAVVKLSDEAAVLWKMMDAPTW